MSLYNPQSDSDSSVAAAVTTGQYLVDPLLFTKSLSKEKGYFSVWNKNGMEKKTSCSAV